MHDQKAKDTRELLHDRTAVPESICFTRPFASLLVHVLIIAALTFASYGRNRLWWDSLTMWEDVVAKVPTNARALCSLAGVYRSRGMIDQAVQSYRKAITIAPTFAEAHTALAVLYLDQQRFEEAAGHLTQAIDIKPEYAAAYGNRGLVFASLGQFDRAIADYLRALALNPENPKTHNNLGNVYDKTGRHDQAISHYNRAIALDPDFAEARHNRAVAQRGKDLSEAAAGSSSAHRPRDAQGPRGMRAGE